MSDNTEGVVTLQLAEEKVAPRVEPALVTLQFSQSVALKKISRNASPLSKMAIKISSLARGGMDEKWVGLLGKADADGDGLLDVREVADVVDLMLREQDQKRAYRFMAVSLLIMAVVLVGTLSGVTYGIVSLSKETKVSTYSDVNYQFILTKSGGAAVPGAAALDLMSRLTVHTNGTARRSQLEVAAHGDAGRRRVLAQVDSGNWTYYATLDYRTVAQACAALARNVAEFPVRTPSKIFVGGTAFHMIKVRTQSGCDATRPEDVSNVSALVESDNGRSYMVSCYGSSGSPSAPGCDVWQENPTTGTESGGCFPPGATVEVLGRGAVPMAHLRYGDHVRSLDRSTRAVVFRPVFLFGHRQRGGAPRPYVRITTRDTAGRSRSLTATPGHFVPVCLSGCTAERLRAGGAVLENRRAGGIRLGDVLVAADAAPGPAVVTGVHFVAASGAYNPYVRGADIIMDGVLASPHSDWLLDAVAPAWLVPYLPYVYEVLLTPVYGLYCLVGPAAAEWLAHGVGLAEWGASSGGMRGCGGYVAVLAGLAAPAAAVAAALVRAASASRRAKSGIRR